MGILVFIVGLCIGSYLNVLAYRIPKGMSTSKGKSMCPNCGKTLKTYELIPIFSYILLKGKCHKCHEKISIIYPIIELLTATLFLATYLVFGFSFEFFLYILVLSIMVVIIVIDYRYKYIPDRLNFSILGLGLIYTIYKGINDTYQFFDHFLGLFIGFFIVFLIRRIGYILFKKEAMGFGDVKLLAGLGLLLGFKAAIFIFFGGCILASIIEVSLMGMKIKSRESEIAFGPYLIYAGILYMFLGETLIQMYLQFLGG